MDEAALIEKLLKIEAVFAGAATKGERISAERARQRILLRLKEVLKKDRRSNSNSPSRTSGHERFLSPCYAVIR